MTRRPMSVLTAASARLAEAGAASPMTDARLLLMHAGGLSATQLLTAVAIDDLVAARFDELIAQRATGVPVQHLTGETWFRNVRLAVGPGVFIPRPETELVAGAAIDEARKQQPGSLVVELCAGSGAISAAVCDEAPGARVIAVEKDAQAAQWLRRNLAATSAEVVEADMAAALPDRDAQAAVVVANPPYIPWSQRDGLPVEVREHDPEAALFAEDDGLGAIRVVIAVAHRLLRPGGLVVIEHGDDQGPAVLDELARAGFGDQAGHLDLSGRPRFVTGRRVPGWDGE